MQDLWKEVTTLPRHRPFPTSRTWHVFLCGTEWHTLKDVRSRSSPRYTSSHCMQVSVVSWDHSALDAWLEQVSVCARWLPLPLDADADLMLMLI